MSSSKYEDVRFLIGTPAEGVSPKDLNLYILSKYFKEVLDVIEYIKRKPTGQILIKLLDNHHGRIQLAKHLLEITNNIDGKRITFIAPDELNRHRGIIQHTELQYLTEDEVLQLTEKQGVSSVTKNKEANSCTLFFPRSTPLPETIKLGWDTVRVRKVTPTPLRCKNCCRYGHHTDACRSPTTCPRCAGKHGREACTAKNPNCPACEGNHEVTSPDCPKWKTEKAAAIKRLSPDNNQDTTTDDNKKKSTSEAATQTENTNKKTTIASSTDDNSSSSDEEIEVEDVASPAATTPTNTDNVASPAAATSATSDNHTASSLPTTTDVKTSNTFSCLPDENEEDELATTRSTRRRRKK